VTDRPHGQEEAVGGVAAVVEPAGPIGVPVDPRGGRDPVEGTLRKSQLPSLATSSVVSPPPATLYVSCATSTSTDDIATAQPSGSAPQLVAGLTRWHSRAARSRAAVMPAGSRAVVSNLASAVD
jgi:hypothetical protein